MPRQWRTCSPEGDGRWYLQQDTAINEATLLLGRDGYQPDDVRVERQWVFRSGTSRRATVRARRRARAALKQATAQPKLRLLETRPGR